MKTIVFFTGLMLCAVYSMAQTNYYTTTKTFYETGYTYQCDVIESGDVTLYNKSNKWTHVGQIDTHTGENFAMPEYDYIPLFEDDNLERSIRTSIVLNALSPYMNPLLIKEKRNLIITIYINPITGKVDEVNFEFLNITAYAMIPIQAYRVMEIKLKQQLSYRPTAEGKKLNYILLWWGAKD